MGNVTGGGLEPEGSNQKPGGGSSGKLMISFVVVLLLLGGAFLLMSQNGLIEFAELGGEPKTSEPEKREELNTSARDFFKQSANREVLPGVKSVAPQTPWLTLEPDKVLTRIGVGSCLSQLHPQPIWEGVLRLEPRPQLFMMIGDNVYGDIRSPDAKELVEAYRDQAFNPELARARQAMPFLAIWDDHDYGGNDKGGTFAHKRSSAKLFHDFWQLEPQRDFDKGIYYSRTFGPEGKRVQIIMLDTRSFRSNWKRRPKKLNQWGRYGPDDDPEKTILGKAQWAWLEEKLSESADVRLIISSYQFMSEGHGFERWGLIPHERQRLIDLIDSTGARGVIILSGDRHFGAFYQSVLKGGQRLPEMTASSLNRSYGPSRDAESNLRMSEMYNQENFGLVDIDWRLRRVNLILKDMNGETLDSLTVKFKDLKID
ncbi:MAG: alkaline phosphatase D family protein [Filomicrobium sp.]